MNISKLKELEFLDVYDQDSETLRESLINISNLLKQSIKELSINLKDIKLTKLTDAFQNMIPNISYYQTTNMAKVYTSIDRMLLFIDSKIMNAFNSAISIAISTNPQLKECYKKLINFSKKSAEIRMELIYRDEVESFVNNLDDDLYDHDEDHVEITNDTIQSHTQSHPLDQHQSTIHARQCDETESAYSFDSESHTSNTHSETRSNNSNPVFDKKRNQNKNKKSNMYDILKKTKIADSNVIESNTEMKNQLSKNQRVQEKQSKKENEVPHKKNTYEKTKIVNKHPTPVRNNQKPNPIHIDNKNNRKNSGSETIPRNIDIPRNILNNDTSITSTEPETPNHFTQSTTNEKSIGNNSSIIEELDLNSKEGLTNIYDKMINLDADDVDNESENSDTEEETREALEAQQPKAQGTNYSENQELETNSKTLPDTSTKIEFEQEDEQRVIQSRPTTSHMKVTDEEGPLCGSQLDSFFAELKPAQRREERITINVNVTDSHQDSSTKVLKTEVEVDGELIRHESLMTEMHADHDDDDDENIELLKTLLDDEGDGSYDALLLNQSNQSIEKIGDMDDDLLLVKTEEQPEAEQEPMQNPKLSYYEHRYNEDVIRKEKEQVLKIRERVSQLESDPTHHQSLLNDMDHDIYSKDKQVDPNHYSSSEVPTINNPARIIHLNDPQILEIEKYTNKEIQKVTLDDFPRAKEYNYKFENIFTYYYLRDVKELKLNPKQDIFGTLQEFYTQMGLLWNKFIDYNKELIMKDAVGYESKSLSLDSKPKWYKIETAKEEVVTIVDTAFKRYEYWHEMPHGQNLKSTFNLYWSWSKPKQSIQPLLLTQRINHFPKINCITRKDNLYRTLCKAMKRNKKCEKAFDIVPKTFVIPMDYQQFCLNWASNEATGADNVWIMKPAGSSRGRGIQLITEIYEVRMEELVVIQEYVRSPMLIDKRKFDLRIYALVTSFNPLEAFLYGEGFARISTQEYSLTASNLNKNHIHLTNTSVNKGSAHYVYNQSKLMLKDVALKLKDQYNLDFWTQIWPQVREIVVKSLMAANPFVAHNPNCFELLGYDIMIDSDGRCTLIEVNASPSLSKDCLIDELVKQKMLDEMIDIIDPHPIDYAQLQLALEKYGGSFKVKPRTKTKREAYETLRKTYELEQTLKGVFGDKPIRKYGQKPKALRVFQSLIPGPEYDRIDKYFKMDTFNKWHDFG